MPRLKRPKFGSARSRVELIAALASRPAALATPAPPKEDAPDAEREDGTVECEHCGEQTPSDGKFCAYCGKALELEDADAAGEMTAAAPGEVPTPGAPETPAAEEGGETPDLNEPPEMPENDAAMGPAFTIPVGVIEGQPTGDGRSIALDALDWRTPPLPLMLLATSTHDPIGMDMNAPAVLAGRIDSLERTPGEGSTQIVSAKGFFLNDENGQYASSLTEQMGRLGVSADIAVEESEIEITEIDDMGFPIEMNDELTKGTIMAFTACPMPAFEGAYMVLGDGSEIPEAIPQSSEQEPVTAAAPIHLMTYAQCEPCEQGLDVVVASGGPTRPPKAWFANPQFTPGDGRLLPIMGSNGEEKYACPLTVTEDGQVFGHIAPWDVCHTGKSGCVTAPSSPSDYAVFTRGYVVTAEGDRVRVGTITADVGHAPVTGLSSVAALGHYDNAAYEVADVAAGEDDYGIWVAGALRPGASEAQVRKLTAGSISGDWRSFGEGLDLIAALAVPLPGFPVVTLERGEQQAVVASGAQIMQALKSHAGEHPTAMPPSTARAIDRLVRNDARARVAALR